MIVTTFALRFGRRTSPDAYLRFRAPPSWGINSGLRNGRAVVAWPMLVMIAVLFLTIEPSKASSQVTAPLSVEEELTRLQVWANNIAPVTLSPDGKWVAFVARNRSAARFDASDGPIHPLPGGISLLHRGIDVWIARTSTGELSRISDGNSANRSPVWSPDGKTLAYVSDRDGKMHVWSWDSSSRQSTRISELVVEGFDANAVLQWTRDGKGLLVQAPSLGAGTEAVDSAQGNDGPGASTTYSSRTHVTVYHGLDGDSTALVNLYGRDATPEALLAARPPSDLAIIDVASARIQRILRRVRPSGYWLSPSGDRIAIGIMDTTRTTASRSCDIRIVDLRNAVSTTLVHEINQVGCNSVSWSPTGDTLAYTTLDSSGDVDVYTVSPTGRVPPVLLTPGPHTGIRVPRDRGPQWAPDGRGVFLLGIDTIWYAGLDGSSRVVATSRGRDLVQLIGCSRSSALWSPDGHHALFAFTVEPRSKRMGVVRVDVESGRTEVLFESDQSFALRNAFDCLGRALVYVAETSASSPDLWLTNDAFATRRRLTVLNPGLEGREFGRARLVNWLGLHGDSLQGILILPAAYDTTRRYPLIVSLYGGTRPAALLNSFGLVGTSVAGPLNLQLFATRGYAVLVPDATFRSGKTMMFDLAAAVLPGINRLIEQGIVDPGRIGVTGLSFGGYSALALATQTGRFKAVVSRSGFSDFSSHSAIELRASDGHSPAFVNSERLYRMAGTVWDRRNDYINNSPFYYLDRVTAAVLVVHGAGDETVSPALANQTYSALRRLGKTVEYALYEGEGHGEAAWSYGDARDELHRIIDWFDRFLKRDGTKDTR